MNELNKELKLIGTLLVIYGAVSLFTLSYTLFLGIVFIVIGIRIITNKRIIAKKAVLICDIINLAVCAVSLVLVINVRYILSIIAAINMVIAIILGLIIFFKIQNYEKAYQSIFSTDFQYDYPEESQNAEQSFSYLDNDNTNQKKQQADDADSKRICNKCGKVVKSRSLYCPYCGNNSFSKYTGE